MISILTLSTTAHFSPHLEAWPFKKPAVNSLNTSPASSESELSGQKTLAQVNTDQRGGFLLTRREQYEDFNPPAAGELVKPDQYGAGQQTGNRGGEVLACFCMQQAERAVLQSRPP